MAGGDVLSPVTAACPAGSALLGGGGSVVLDADEDRLAPAVLASTRPDDIENPRAWEVTAVATRGGRSVTVEAFAMCGPVQDVP